MSTQQMSGLSPSKGGRPCSSSAVASLNGTYECWTNEASSEIHGNVYRENKLKYKNTQHGPVMSDADVDALLRREPNAVKNIINSLNEQMRQKMDVGGASDSLGYMQSLAGVYEPEFGREIEECNVSVKKRITIFDKKVGDSGKKESMLPSDEQQDFISYSSSSSLKERSDHDFEDCRDSYDNLNPQGDLYTKLNCLQNQGPIPDQGPKSTTPPCSIVLDEENIGERRQVPVSPLDSASIYQLLDGSKSCPNVKLGTSPVATKLQLSCNSDRSHCSSNDSFGPLYKEWSRKENALTKEGEVNTKSTCDYRPSDFGDCTTGEPAYAEETSNEWTPSLLSSRSYDDLLTGKLELPVEAGCRDLEAHPKPEDAYPTEVEKSGETQDEPGRFSCAPFVVKTQKETITLSSVNIIKAGWTWMHSSRARRWFPKYLVLFYDDVETTSPYHIRAKMRRVRAMEDGSNTAKSFWDIYKIYSHIGSRHSVMRNAEDMDPGVNSGANTAPHYVRRNVPTSTNVPKSHKYASSRPNNSW